jgi:hypothetical protein
MSTEISSDEYTPIHYMISNKDLSCDKVAFHLRNVGISGTVTSQKTINCDKTTKKCVVENGCLLTLYNSSLKDFLGKVANPLHKENSLNCGYLRIDGIFTGCINNLNRKSNCEIKHDRRNVRF